MVTREQQIAGLREFADFLEQNPEVPMEDWRIGITYYTYDDEPVKQAARAVAGWDKIYSDNFLDLAMSFGRDPEMPDSDRNVGLRYVISVAREKVCEAKVVGKKVVKKRDPEALKAVPMIEVEEDIVEWECTPLLAPSEG